MKISQLLLLILPLTFSINAMDKASKQQAEAHAAALQTEQQSTTNVQVRLTAEQAITAALVGSDTLHLLKNEHDQYLAPIKAAVIAELNRWIDTLLAANDPFSLDAAAASAADGAPRAPGFIPNPTHAPAPGNQYVAMNRDDFKAELVNIINALDWGGIGAVAPADYNFVTLRTARAVLITQIGNAIEAVLRATIFAGHIDADPVLDGAAHAGLADANLGTFINALKAHLNGANI